MKLNLPHLAPIKFAQELIDSTERTCTVSASFPHIPSLAMIIEAAAQSSAGFSKKSNEKIDVAFLVMLKDVKLIQKCTVKELTFFLKAEQEMGNIIYFSFEAKNVEKTIALGTFSIAKNIQ